MSCEICGRNSCISSFHSIEEQQNFDNVADKIKDRTKQSLSNKMNRLDYEIINDIVYIKLDDVIETIEDY